MNPNDMNGFFRFGCFGADIGTGTIYTRKPKQERVTTEPKIIVHPPKYGGVIEEKQLAVGNG